MILHAQELVWDKKDFEEAGIPKGTLYRAMSGKGIKPETLGKIAKVLGVDVLDIMETD